MTTPFFITGLPRSRTSWLANWFTWGNSFCHHDGLRTCGPVDLFGSTLKSEVGPPSALRPLTSDHCYLGNSDSALPLCADAIMERFPRARWLVVLRDREQALDSWWHYFGIHPYIGQAEISFDGLRKTFNRFESALERLQQTLPERNWAKINFESLNDWPSVQQASAWLTPNVEYPAARFALLTDLRVNPCSEKISVPPPEWGAKLLREAKV